MSLLLDIQDIHVSYAIRSGGVLNRALGTVRAVNGVSLQVKAGEVLGLVGESGCGKSTIARSVLGLVPVTRGKIIFEGQDLAALSPRQRRPLRPRLQMVFQDPYASLNPRMTVFDILAEPIMAHRLCEKEHLATRVKDLMNLVGLAARSVRKYPHEFSGGQRQRIAIARALALEPKLIIADEPVSALDVSIQAQILNLLADIQAQTGLALILISHDLGIVRHLAQRIAVMYLGRIVELGPAEEVFDTPRHPYSQALISAIPLPDPDRERSRQRLLLRGDPPSPLSVPAGCAFHPRCLYADDACAKGVPPLAALNETHEVACIHADEISSSAIPG